MKVVLMLISWVLCLVGFYSVLINPIVVNYHCKRDVVSHFERAQVASDSSYMLKYVEEGKAGMEEYGYTKGHTCFVFKTDLNDLSLIYQAVENLEDRLEVIDTLDKTSPEYMMGMDDARGILRDMMESESTSPHISAGNFVYKTQIIWVLFGLLELLVSFILGGIVDALTPKHSRVGDFTC